MISSVSLEVRVKETWNNLKADLKILISVVYMILCHLTTQTTNTFIIWYFYININPILNIVIIESILLFYCCPLQLNSTELLSLMSVGFYCYSHSRVRR